jgi:hypothetical protein
MLVDFVVVRFGLWDSGVAARRPEDGNADCIMVEASASDVVRAEP